MKQKIFMFGLVLLVTLAIAVPAYAKATTVTADIEQAQFQWRASSGPYSATPTYSYWNDSETMTLTLTGHALHTEWSYSPLVTDLQGESTVYTYSASCSCWIEHEGQVTYKYVAGYGDYPIANFFRGYLSFNDSADPNSGFAHGVAYQWVYLYAPQNATLVSPLDTNAVWDPVIGAWLVGFSIYIWDSSGFDQSGYATQMLPTPYIEPVPASNFNPLGL
jgi:hypothetical protein